MKRRDLLRVVARIAEAHDATRELDREGANHSLWRMNRRKIAVPRHREIREGLARTILRQATDAARETSEEGTDGDDD